MAAVLAAGEKRLIGGVKRRCVRPIPTTRAIGRSGVTEIGLCIGKRHLIGNRFLWCDQINRLTRGTQLKAGMQAG